MFPWRSAWSTSGKAGVLEGGVEVLRAHGLGTWGERAQPLSQLETLIHVGKGRLRIGRDEQVRPDRVLLEVANEPLAVRHSRVALAVAPDRVRLPGHVLG